MQHNIMVVCKQRALQPPRARVQLQAAQLRHPATGALQSVVQPACSLFCQDGVIVRDCHGVAAAGEEQGQCRLGIRPLPANFFWGPC